MSYYEENIRNINGKCFIYRDHIRNETNEKIYVGSLCVDSSTLYYGIAGIQNLAHLSWEDKYNYNKDICKIMRENEFIDYNLMRPFIGPHNEGLKNKIMIQVTQIETINEPIFFFPYDMQQGFYHTVIYGYVYFYYYLYLKTKYPNLKIIMQETDNKYWLFLKNTLNLCDILYVNPNKCYINLGTTFCVYSQMEASSLMNVDILLFYNRLAKLSLSQNTLNVYEKEYPKKLLFLRNKTNVSRNSGCTLSNTNEVVGLCKQYEYVLIDQTTYSMEETMYLMNNATHIITEAGSSIIHLLWTNKINAILLCWRYEAYHLFPEYWSNANKHYQLLDVCNRKNMVEILKSKNTTIVHNIGDELYINLLEGHQNHLPHSHSLSFNSHFYNLKGLEDAMKEQN